MLVRRLVAADVESRTFFINKSPYNVFRLKNRSTDTILW